MNQHTISGIEELLRFTRDASNDVCYRGQSDASWSLVPSFYRGLEQYQPPPSDVDDGQWLGELERDVYRNFELKGRRHAPKGWEFHEAWHRMILAQHHGLPTRLLDWSKSAVVAAYFAVTANPDVDAALWCLDISETPFPSELGRRMANSGFRLNQLEACIERDQLSFHWPVSEPFVSGAIPTSSNPKPYAIPSFQSGSPDRDGFLVVIEPPVLEGRLHSQKSLFSVYVAYDEHQLVWDHREYIEQMEQHHGKQLLTKLVVPRCAKEPLRRDLENNFVDVDDIFPDMPGLIERLKRRRADEFRFWKEDRKKWNRP
jgi:hypothetical protein